MPFIGYTVADTGYTLRELHEESLLIGRGSECDVVLPSPKVSRRHVEISRDGDTFTVADLGSSNGSSLNGRKLTDSRILVDRDCIEVDNVRFTFFSDEDPPSSTGTMYTATLESETVIAEDSLASRRIDAVHEITERLSEARTNDEALHAFVAGLFALFPHAVNGSVVVQQARTDIIVRLRRCEREETESLDGSQFVRARNLLSEVMSASSGVRKEASVPAGNADEKETLEVAVPTGPVMAAPICGAHHRSLGAVVLERAPLEEAFSESDLTLLNSVSSLAGRTLETLQFSLDHEDLRAAERVQAILLPDEAPQIPGYQFQHFYQAALQVGGDYFDYVQLDEHRTAIALGDVVGKGAAAALQMSRLNSAVRLTLPLNEEPHAVAETLNQLFYDNRAAGQFVTFMLAVLDSKDHSVTIVSAGHCAAIVQSGDRSFEFPEHSAVGIPLGINEDEQYTSRTITLERGDTLVLFTDGLIEAQDEDRLLFGMQRVRECLQDSQTSAEEAVAALRSQALSFAAPKGFSDDVCIVALHRE